MPFGGIAVVDRTLREGKTVMGAGIDLDLVVRSLHAGRDLVDNLLRRIDVGLGAGEIEFSPGLRRGQMRAVGLVGREMRAVDRSRRLHAIRKMRRRVDRVAAAHAVADGADDFRVRRFLRLGIGEQGLGVFHHHGNVDRVHEAEHPLALGRFRIRRDRSQLHDAGAVIHIGQHHVITRGAEPPRHVTQFLADCGSVHVEDDDRKRPAAFGMGDEGGGLAVLGRNIDLLVDHGRFFFRCDSGCRLSA